MRILGLDGGMASVGWAVIEFAAAQRKGGVLACGTRMFDSPEGKSNSGPFLKNAERRTYRLSRRVLKRRRCRMRKLRTLFKIHGLLPDDGRDALAGHGTDPWELRAQALERELQPRELALALGHIARHRGYKSNKKGEQGSNKPDDDKKLLRAIKDTQERLSRYTTVGEMFARDPRYTNRKRNREKDYTCSILRDDQETEVHIIFQKQRQFGNAVATETLENNFSDIAFFQRPLQSSLELVGPCPFVDNEKRASAFAPSFERFRFLSKLATLRIAYNRELRPLSPDEFNQAVAHYGKTKTYSYKALRKVIDLADEETFYKVAPDKEGNDFVRTKGAAAGTKTLVDVLQPAIGSIETHNIQSEAKTLDDAMKTIAFNEDMAKIESDLKETDLPEAARMALLQAAKEGTFDFVNGTGHISAAAAHRLNPHLEKGLRYDEACTAEGWDHAAQSEVNLEDIKSPVARKAAIEILKQVRILARVHGPFDIINVEMARDVGKGIEERGRIERGIKRRTSERNKVREALQSEPWNIRNPSGDQILRYELMVEQRHRCLYSGRGIEAHDFLANDNRLQVDHILPFSRFADNSYHNKTLCFTSTNQQKRARTPFEWLRTERPDYWETFRTDVEACKAMKGMKKRNYLLMDAAELEEKWRQRNLNDTRYALRVVLGILRKEYPDFSTDTDRNSNARKRRRIFARPGAITAALRRAWGLESLKRDSKTGKRRSDDRHHALDAIITACCSEALLQQATRHAQEQERLGEKFELSGLSAPWGSIAQFRQEVAGAMAEVFVSRPEIGRLRGKAHEASIKQIRHIDGVEKLFERKSIDELKLDHLDLIPVPQPYGKIKDPAKLRDQLVENLHHWIKQKTELKERIAAIRGKSEEKTTLQEKLKNLPPPLSPKGDPIKKVRLLTNAKPAVAVRGGSADREGLVRVDVFTKPNKSGVEQYYLVPIYRNDVYNDDESLRENPPNRAVAAHKPEGEWPEMDPSYQFRFSLYQYSLIKIARKQDPPIIGYYRGIDRASGNLALSPPEDSTQLIRGIGAKTLRDFRKYTIDRLGNIHEIEQEVRTWRGKVCT